MGELTPRDEAETLIPIDKYIKDTLQRQKFLETKQIRMDEESKQQELLHNDPNYHPSIHNQIRKMRLNPTHPLKDRKDFLVTEHERIKQLVEFQKNKILSSLNK
jgi:hypothetical protein